jgi:hypothetical protein
VLRAAIHDVLDDMLNVFHGSGGQIRQWMLNNAPVAPNLGAREGEVKNMGQRNGC